MNLLGMDWPLRKYWKIEKNRRRTRRLRRMARTLHRGSNNEIVNSGNLPANNRNRTRLARLHLGNRNSMGSIAPNNWGSTPKSNE